MPAPPPVALTIAGSDSCAGAGLQADLKTFGALGVHGLSVVTAVVAETPFEVADLHELPTAVLQKQLSLLLDTYPVAAVKTGMLYSKAHVVAVADLLQGRGIPLVVDPVMIATSGTALLTADAVEVLVGRLLPLATLITPNLPELTALLPAAAALDAAAQVEALANRFSCSVLLTGGHDSKAGRATDVLWHDGALHTYQRDWIDLPSSHGTGCTISAAITAGLAKGWPLPEAVQAAKEFVTSALLQAHRWELDSGRILVALDQVTQPDKGAGVVRVKCLPGP